MYEVVVADNYHYGEAEYETSAGRFRSWEEAVERCVQIVDESLRRLHEPGNSAERLWSQYVMFGEDPFVVPAGDQRFSAWEYARRRCAGLCRT